MIFIFGRAPRPTATATEQAADRQQGYERHLQRTGFDRSQALSRLQMKIMSPP